MSYFSPPTSSGGKAKVARFKKVKNEKEPVLPSQAWSTPVKQKSGSGDEDAAQSYLSGRVERVSSTGDALFDGINAGWGATVGAVGGALSAATGPVLSIGGEEEEKAGGGATETVRSDVTGGNNGGHKDTAEDETDNIDELDDLVAIKGAKLKSWEKSTGAVEVDGIHSLKESKIEKQMKKHPAELLRYMASRLIRIYPDNLRFDSSNYDPVPSWNYGCQVVALNYQTPDLPMQLNRGRFRDNGNCGFVLRPPFLNPPAPKRSSKRHGRLRSLGRRRRRRRTQKAGGEQDGQSAVAAAASAAAESGGEVRRHTLADDDEDGFASDYDMDQSDGESTSEDEEEEDGEEEKLRWEPPTHLEEYLRTSPFATEVGEESFWRFTCFLINAPGILPNPRLSCAPFCSSNRPSP